MFEKCAAFFNRKNKVFTGLRKRQFPEPRKLKIFEGE